MATGISSPLALGGMYPSVDGRYVAANGKPFTSVSNAESALNGFPSKLSESCVGLTVLVKESGWAEAKEYWVQPKGTTPETYGLVEKGAGTTDYNDLDNKPTIGDGTNTALPIVGNVKVSASTASGSTAGVTVTPGQNTGEIEMQFTLPKGDNGEDGADGQDGAPGHNPNLGTYLDTDTNKPTTGQAGDYFIVIDTTVTPRTASVYAWNGTAFADTEKSVEDFGLQFASGQSVADVHIKDENGDDDTNAQGVLSAEAGTAIRSIQQGSVYNFSAFVVDYYFNTSTYECTAGAKKGVLIPIESEDILKVMPASVGVGSVKFIFLATKPVVGDTLEPITIVGSIKVISCGTLLVPYAKLQAPEGSKYVLINQRDNVDPEFDDIKVNGISLFGKIDDIGLDSLVKTKSIFLTNPAEGADVIKELYLQGLDQNTNYHISLVCYPDGTNTPHWQLLILDGTSWKCRLTVNGLSFKGLYELETHNEGDPTGYVVVDGNPVDRMPKLSGSQGYIFHIGEDNYLIKENCENLDFSPTIRAYLNKSYAVCSTTAVTAQKEISKDTYTLGDRMLVKMENVNTASEVTLKVNEETAYPLYYNGSVASSENTWKAGEALDIYFDGTNYQATSFIGGGSESVEDLNSVIGTGTLKNLVDTLITEWTQGRYGLSNRGFADAETYVRFNGNASGYSVSNTFDVKKGTIIEFDHGSESTIVSQGVILIVKVEEGSEPTAILMPDNLSESNALVGITGYRFTVPYDMTIRLGTRNPYNNNSFYKIYESGIQQDNDLVRTTYPIAFSSADEYRDLMSQATKVDSYNGSDSELTTGWKDTQVTLLHYSDIHGDLDRLKRILEFRKRYSTLESIIDDIICTGDMCGSRYANYNEAFDTLPGYNRVLQVIGNHDVYDADGTHGSSGYDAQDYYATEQQKYERYMANASTWGVVKPSGAGENGYYPCYYYKDYVANRTYASDDAYKQKVRLIVLDAMIKTTDTALDTAQKKWFAATLLDAKTNGKHVVVADHFSYRDNNTNHFEAGGFDCMIDEWGGNIGNFGIKMKTYAEIVNYYINGGTYTIDGVSYDFGTGGGEFVCWLCGHFHWDMVGATTTYPKQVFIAVGSASIKTPMQHRARVVGEESEDLFNIVSIDTFRKHIRVFRVGAKWDRYLEHAGTMCISYDSSGNNVPHLISHF